MPNDNKWSVLLIYLVSETVLHLLACGGRGVLKCFK